MTIIMEFVIGDLEREVERLAAEGYRYYGSEAQEFATLSGYAVAEAIDDEYC